MLQFYLCFHNASLSFFQIQYSNVPTRKCMRIYRYFILYFRHHRHHCRHHCSRSAIFISTKPRILLTKLNKPATESPQAVCMCVCRFFFPQTHIQRQRVEPCVNFTFISLLRDIRIVIVITFIVIVVTKRREVLHL